MFSAPPISVYTPVFVAQTNMELMKEEHYRKIEGLLTEGVHLAKQSGIEFEELSEILRMLYEEE